jgi:DNA-binding GntR family transcriptional regulator
VQQVGRKTRSSRKEIAYSQLKHQIIIGELTAGMPLVEHELSEKYDISRTPIREILHRLSHEGLVDMYPNKGAFVKTLTPKDLSDIFQLREAIEGMASRLASQYEDKSTIQEIRLKLLALDVNHSPIDAAEGVKVGKSLHDFIASSSGNSLLYKSYIEVSAQAALVRSLTQSSIEIEQHSYTEHLAIIDALQRSDMRDSEEAMRKHLRMTYKRILETLH